jgi:hypothetical protein
MLKSGCQPSFRGQTQHRFEPRQILAPDNRRLVGQHMQSGLDQAIR